MFTIQTYDNISSTGLAQFPNYLYKIGKEMPTPDAVLVRSSPLHDVQLPSHVKVVGRAGVGVNNIPIAALTTQGIPVLNTPGANANAVKEIVLTGMLLASRHICSAWHYAQQLTGDDKSISDTVEKNKKQFVGNELMGKTLGVIGLGNIGVKVANAALALGMKVLGHDPDITVKRALELSADVQQADSLQDLLTHSNFITVHVPLSDHTHHLINADRLSILKPGAVLLNFSRESIVDQSALLKAFEQHRLGAYVTDFPQKDLLHHPQVISLPHLGASTQEAEENCAMMVVHQVRDFLENGQIKNSVNFPDVHLTYNSGFRIGVVNANVPNMVAQISHHLGQAGLNILDLINKSRGEIAYTLLDVNQSVSDSIINEIAAIHGVIKVRRIQHIDGVKN